MFKQSNKLSFRRILQDHRKIFIVFESVTDRYDICDIIYKIIYYDNILGYMK